MLNKHKCLFVSIIFYCLSIFIFMIAQLSIVGGTFMSGSIFSYNYSLRVAMNCLAIAFAILAVVFGKTKKKITIIRILLSAAIISKKRWTAKRQLLMKKIPFGNSPSYGDRKRYKPPPYFYSTAFPCVCYQNLANTGERRRVFFPAFSCKKREKRSVFPPA